MPKFFSCCFIKFVDEGPLEEKLDCMINKITGYRSKTCDHGISSDNVVMKSRYKYKSQRRSLSSFCDMSLYWLCYRLNNSIFVVIEPRSCHSTGLFTRQDGVRKQE